MASSSCKTLGTVDLLAVLNYRWMIPKFLKHFYENAEVGSSPILKSPMFSERDNTRMKCCYLCLTLSEVDPRYLSISLLGLNFAMNCQINLSVVDLHMQARFECVRNFTSRTDESITVPTFVNGYYLISQKDEILHPDDTLIIKCQIKMGNIILSNLVVEDRFRVADDLQGLLYNDKTYSDLNFTVKDKEFHAHRCVLAVRCRRLLDVIEEKIKHTDTRLVDLTSDFKDFQPEIMKEALSFIYTGRVSSSVYKNFKQLHSFAEKYDLPRLKNICAKAIPSLKKSNINLQNE